jgi:hypothetical protein
LDETQVHTYSINWQADRLTFSVYDLSYTPNGSNWW